MLAINQFKEDGLSTLVTSSAGIGVISMIVFVFVESKVAFPLMPLSFFRRRNFTASLSGSFFSGAAYMGGFILAPTLLQSVFGYSIAATSMIMLVRPLAFSVTSPVGGSAATRIGERPVALFGTASITLALIGLGFGTEWSIVTLVIAALVVQGIGNGTAQPTLTATLSNSVDESDLGVAAAAQRMAFQVGAAVGITTMTSIYGGTGQASDFLNAYLVGAALGVAAVMFAWMMRSTPRDAYHAPAATDAELPAIAAR